MWEWVTFLCDTFAPGSKGSPVVAIVKLVAVTVEKVVARAELEAVRLVERARDEDAARRGRRQTLAQRQRRRVLVDVDPADAVVRQNDPRRAAHVRLRAEEGSGAVARGRNNLSRRSPRTKRAPRN